MTISVNGEEIDFKLEAETTAGEVMAGLSDWLEYSGLLLGGIRLDGNNVGLADQVWRAKPLSDIRFVEIEAITVRAGRIRQLETARDYLTLLKVSADEGNEEVLADLAENYRDLYLMLPNILDEGPNPVIVPHLEKVFKDCGFPPPEGSKIPDPKKLSGEAAKMAELMENRLREAIDPEKEAASAAAALASIADTLDDVAVNLQTGKDRKAIDTIIRMTEMLQKLMRCLYWAGGNKASEVAADMNGILSELEVGLKVGDTVLIGDLLEYEIKPRLTDLPARLKLATEELQ
jgi:hypothetical protein